MHPTPDSRGLHRAARGISPQVLARAALDPSPTSLGTARQPCLSGFGILAADGSEHQPLLAPMWTQAEHERHPHYRDAAALGMPRVVKASVVSSCSHQAALDRNNFACLRLTSVCQTSAALLDQASRRLTGQKHRSMAGQTDAGVISADRTHGPKHARNGR